MKKILFGLSALACIAATPAAYAAFPKCVDFSAAGYCDAMQYDAKRSATWHNYDCGGSQGLQTKASWGKELTKCTAASGCNPAAAYGWDYLNWQFDFTASTGTLTGLSGGVVYTLQQDMPVAISKGSCAVANQSKGGISSLAR